VHKRCWPQYEKASAFLDRDGVINLDHGYVHRSAEVVFLDGIFELGMEAKRSGYLVVVVTNQA
jgi:D-glycero-D-manno-heptose 1,7-bisphosphate phosphatase